MTLQGFFFFALGLGTALQTSFLLDVYMNSLEAVRVQRKDHFGGILGNVTFNVFKGWPTQEAESQPKVKTDPVTAGSILTTGST